ncbi:hypothetical protein [Mycoplasma sp. CSL7503-lung]|uniref:hypothetical protein n=1 Tax=Mycoplasma sp. CSL7503-lung TaxID=536372 RepID=UPI0021CE8EBB|nr:hypothetical protein [Mycoplasma sp. CSL7503-lung]MCU4706335.1 hypothetical protein [Mycoplasma sp. CSL7503-lung]
MNNNINYLQTNFVDKMKPHKDSLNDKDISFNKLKYTLGMFLSILATITFRFNSSIFIAANIHNDWFVSLFYLMIQLPSVIIYFLGPNLAKKFSPKQLIFIADFGSILFLLILLISNIFIDNITILLIGIFIVNTVYAFSDGIRLIATKNIVYYSSIDSNTLHSFNILNILAYGSATFLSPILGFLIEKYVEFKYIMIFNLVAFILSDLIYLLIQQKKIATEFTKQNTKKQLEKENNTHVWIFAISSMMIIQLFLYPRQAGIIQFLKEIKDFEIEKYGYLYRFILYSSGLISTILLLILSKFKYKIKSNKIFHLLMWIIFVLHFVFIFVLFFSKNNTLLLVGFFSLSGFQNFFNSYTEPTSNNIIYQNFSKKDYNKQNAYALSIRIIVYSLIIVVLTIFYRFFNFKISFSIFTVILFINVCLISYSKYKIDKK